MSTYDSHTREQLRQAYVDAWRKQGDGAPLSAVETMIVEVIAVHPEYQAVLHDSHAALAVDSPLPQSEENSFLHMGLHLAVREQLTIDRPPGIRQLHRDLQALGGAHRAEHGLMEALAETLWEAQRAGHAPDENEYLRLARRRARGASPT